MKKFILTIALTLLMIGAFAQEKSDSVRVYATLTLPTTLSSNPTIDYGDGNIIPFRTPDGRKAKSFVSALNYLAVNGWKIECSFSKREDESYIIISKMVPRKEAEAISANGLK